MSQATFAKREREKARQEKAAAKAAKRAERQATASDDTAAPLPPTDEAALLEELAALHARFDARDISYEDFESAKESITQRLRVV